MEQKDCAGGIVVGPNGGILVVKNQLGRFVLPKGAVKKGEEQQPQITAVREIKEESGLRTVRVIQCLGVLTREGYTATNREAPSVMKRIVMFHCTTEQLELGPFTPDIDDALWTPLDDVPGALSWPEEVAFFNEHLHRLGLQPNPDIA